MRKHAIRIVVLAASFIVLYSRMDNTVVATPSSHRHSQPNPDFAAHEVAPSALTRPLQAPRAARAAAREPVVSLPLAVDGAVTPDRIPDAVAYRHFIKAAAISRTPLPDDVARRDGFIARVGLSLVDRAALNVALEGVKEALDVIAEDGKNLPPVDTPALQSLRTVLKSQEDRAFEDARARLTASLTPADGLAQLEDHIRRQIKPRIKVYRESPK